MGASCVAESPVITNFHVLVIYCLVVFRGIHWWGERHWSIKPPLVHRKSHLGSWQQPSWFVTSAMLVHISSHVVTSVLVPGSSHVDSWQQPCWFLAAMLVNWTNLCCCRYERVDELIWVKSNQLQRIIRTGRTGHWLNHGKEHCLVRNALIAFFHKFFFELNGCKQDQTGVWFVQLPGSCLIHEDSIYWGDKRETNKWANNNGGKQVLFSAKIWTFSVNNRSIFKTSTGCQ